MIDKEIIDILDENIKDDEDYDKVLSYIENLHNIIYAKNNTNRILISEKKELQNKINKLEGSNGIICYKWSQMENRN